MEIIYSSAVEMAAAIRRGEVSATEVVSAHLDEIEARNQVLNAVVILDAERAIARARAADDALARGEDWGPLHGVPFTLKDAHATAGLRTTSGYPWLADYVPAHDGTVAFRLKATGGILLGKTNVPAMLGDYQSDSPIFGRTNNPWNIERTPGGSSGGAAAAVASGMTPFDVGTDLAGSIRVPAHFCGVFGLKPTEHRVSLAGLVPGMPPPRPIRIMSCIGPIARCVEDVSLLYRIITGPDGADTDIPPVPIDPVPMVDLAGLKIGVAMSFPGIPTATDIQDAVRSLARCLTDAGAVVDEAELPALDLAGDVASVGELVATLTGATRPTDNPTTVRQYLEALQRRDQSIIGWERFFNDWDALICPAAMTTAFPHCETGSPLLVDGRPVSYWSVSAYTALFNYSGHPAIVLPVGFDHKAMPIGVQLVSRRWDDSRLLAMAAAISTVTGGFQAPSAVPALSND